MALDFAKPVASIRRGQTSATLTIAGGATTSDAFDARPWAMLGLVTPAALTGATLTFQVSTDGSSFVTLYDSTNTLVSLPVTINAARAYDLPPELASWPYFRLVSSATEAASRSLLIVGKG